MATIIALGKKGKKQGFKTGDKIVSFDGELFVDVLDIAFYDSLESFFCVVERKGKLKTIKVKKKAEDSLGIEIDEELTPARCKNKCTFCFVDQMPKNMRSALYVKDDDYRFSFISGSYITLTNVTESDIERILRLKLSPLYISVHAMDDKVRYSLVKNPATLKLREIMQRLSDGGIKMHTQLVIVPGVNDGAVLEDSIEKLHQIENVLSVAVVPVGLTKHREGLEKISPIDKEGAKKIIEQTERLYKKFGGFCYAADELYMKAGKKIPEYDYYQDFPQIENGVGLVREFLESVSYSLDTEPSVSINKKGCMLTGVSFYPVLNETAKLIEKKTGLSLDVFAVKNKFFGETVTVSGLVTATDIDGQAPRGYDFYTVPSNMLKEFSTVFLDNVSLKDLSERLGAPIIVLDETGKDLISKLSELI